MAIGGSTRMWHALIQYRQGTNAAPEASRGQKEARNIGTNLHPRLLGTGIQAGGSLILSTHLKKWYDR